MTEALIELAEALAQFRAGADRQPDTVIRNAHKLADAAETVVEQAQAQAHPRYPGQHD